MYEYEVYRACRAHKGHKEDARGLFSQLRGEGPAWIIVKTR